MADITIQNLTPKHFYEAVKLLKSTEYRIYYTINTVEIRFPFHEQENFEETQHKFEQMEHLGLFLQELVNSSIPVDLDEFIRTYRKTPRRVFVRSRK